MLRILRMLSIRSALFFSQLLSVPVTTFFQKLYCFCALGLLSFLQKFIWNGISTIVFALLRGAGYEAEK
ncbi:MAG: hypothetical protein AMS15_05905 [Planctomycetes bacterium DG_23]|nr:MAG: hypothetical protein AMS15_05905 [Planctomycetes bacterium DG_23]